MYYVYAYLREDLTPYYIGKGKNNRAWKKGKNEINPPRDKKRIIILSKNLTEIGSFALERRLIRWYGRKDNHTGILRNKTDGGEGSSGSIRSIEFKLKSSERMLSEKNHWKNKKHSEETILKMKVSKPLGFGEKISNRLKNIPKTESHKLNLSLTNLGKKATDETKQKMSLKRKGVQKPKMQCLRCNLFFGGQANFNKHMNSRKC